MSTCWWPSRTISPRTAGSVAPLVNHLGTAYASRCAGQAPGWADLPVQYADYTLWQRAQLAISADSDSPIAAQLDYWEEPSPGCPSASQLPTDRPYPPVADHRGATSAIELAGRAASSGSPRWLTNTTRPASW